MDKRLSALIVDVMRRYGTKRNITGYIPYYSVLLLTYLFNKCGDGEVTILRKVITREVDASISTINNSIAQLVNSGLIRAKREYPNGFVAYCVLVDGRKIAQSDNRAINFVPYYMKVIDNGFVYSSELRMIASIIDAHKRVGNSAAWDLYHLSTFSDMALKRIIRMNSTDAGLTVELFPSCEDVPTSVNQTTPVTGGLTTGAATTSPTGDISLTTVFDDIRRTIRLYYNDTDFDCLSINKAEQLINSIMLKTTTLAHHKW